MKLPPQVSACCAALRGAGYAAHPVGGCVRDLFLGRTPGDWDVATAAPPDAVTALFPRTVPTGIAHGTVTVLFDKCPIEVTTFRRDGAYTDARRPDAVSFDADLTADLARRDFTINAMALDESGGVIDPFGGRADLALRIVRCVGEPGDRFGEDALRMLRALRFCAQLGFSLEAGAAAVIQAQAPRTALVSAERIRVELEKTICAPHPEAGNALFAWGLLDGFTRARPDLSPLAALPAAPLPRWSGLCALTGEHPEFFLPALKLDGRTIRAICAGHLLWHGRAAPDGAPAWRHCLAEAGIDGARAAAAMWAVSGMTGAVDALEAVLQTNPVYQMSQLALTGGEIAALGYEGAEIGRVQRKLLAHVLESPEDNTAAMLRAQL